jgi:hypothetical protein
LDKPKVEMEAHAESVRGSITWKEVERASGVPVNHLLNQLNLPENTSPDRKQGQLSKTYDLQIGGFREAVEGYQK